MLPATATAQPRRGYALICRMAECPNRGRAAVIVWHDAEASVLRENADPDRPLVVEVEGSRPTDDQLHALRTVCLQLAEHFPFTVAGFCPALMPHLAFVNKGD